MAILDVFYILFEGKSEGLKKSSEEAKKHLGDVEEKSKKSEETNKKLGDSFMDIAKSVGTLAAGYMSINAIKSGVFAAVEYTTELDKMSKFLDLNVSSLNAWSGAIKATGYDVGAFQNTIRNLTEPWIKMGHPEKAKAVFETLIALSKEFQTMAPDVAKTSGMQWGLDEGTISFLLKGPDHVRALIAEQKKLNDVTSQTAEEIRALNSEWEKVGTAFMGFWTSFTKLTASAGVPSFLTDIISALKDGTEAWSKYFSASKNEGNIDRVKILLPSNGSEGIILDGPAPEIKNFQIDKSELYSPLDRTKTEIPSLIQTANEQISMANSSPLSSQNMDSYLKSNMMGSKEFNLTTGDIIVQTKSDNPKEIADTINRALDGHFRNAVSNYSDGEDR